jgi:hypothetical protein
MVPGGTRPRRWARASAQILRAASARSAEYEGARNRYALPKSLKG